MFHFLQCVDHIDSRYKQKDQLNKNIITTMKDCLVSFTKIYKTEKEIAIQTKTSLEEEIEVLRKMVEEAYLELDTVKKELHSAKVDLVYMRGLMNHFKNKYPEESWIWRFVNEEEE